MKPQDKKIWVIGASSGIGRAMAVELARAGGRLLLSARRRDRLEQTADSCRPYSDPVDILPLDLEETESLADMAARAERLLGGVDMLVNAAGVGQRGLALETGHDVARRIMNVNFWGPVLLARAVAPGMAERKSGQIVVASSLLGKFGAPRRSFYSASKHALHGWFDSLREELLGTGVEITLLVPGWVKTDISLAALENDGSAHGAMDDGQAGGIRAEECARRAVAAISRGSTEQLIGGMECGGAYLNRLWPGLFRKILRRRGIG